MFKTVVSWTLPRGLFRVQASASVENQGKHNSIAILLDTKQGYTQGSNNAMATLLMIVYTEV